jgi:hypothetical protein
MPAGRPPKPLEQKRLLGNPGKRALPNEQEIVLLPQATSVPEPDRPLLKYGQEMWERIWGLGLTWISPQTDIELCLMTCEMIDERWNLRVKVMGGDDSKQRRALRELDRMIIGNLSLLGFSPTDRMRLGVAEVKKQSKLEELLAKRQERE